MNKAWQSTLSAALGCLLALLLAAAPLSCALAQGEAAAQDVTRAAEAHLAQRQLIILPPYMGNQYRAMDKDFSWMQDNAPALYMLQGQQIPVSVIPYYAGRDNPAYLGTGDAGSLSMAIRTLAGVNQSISDSQRKKQADAIMDTALAQCAFAQETTILLFQTRTNTNDGKQWEQVNALLDAPGVTMYYVCVVSENEKDKVLEGTFLALSDGSEEIPETFEYGQPYHLRGNCRLYAIHSGEECSGVIKSTLEEISFTPWHTLTGAQDHSLSLDNLLSAGMLTTLIHLDGLPADAAVTAVAQDGSVVPLQEISRSAQTGVFSFTGSHGNTIRLLTGEAALTYLPPPATPDETQESAPCIPGVTGFFSYSFDQAIVSLTLQRSDAAGTYAKNQSIGVTVSLQAQEDAQKDALLRDFTALPGSYCVMQYANRDTGFASSIAMDYDEASQTFTGSFLCPSSGQYEITAQLYVGAQTFLSEPLTAVVDNRAPVLPQDDQVHTLWFDDPWAQTSILSIPAHAQDEDGDVLRYSLSSDGTGPLDLLVVPGVGSLTYENGQIVLAPASDASSMAAPAAIYLHAQDDESASAPAARTFRLRSLTGAMESVSLVPSVDPAQAHKRGSVNVSVSVSFEGSAEGLVVEHFLAHTPKIVCTPFVNGVPGGSFDLVPSEGNVYSGVFFAPDTSCSISFSFEPRFSPSRDGSVPQLNVACSKAACQVPNHAPAAKEEAWQLPQSAEMTGKPESYTIAIDPAACFDSVDGDPLTAELILRRDGQSLPLVQQADGSYVCSDAPSAKTKLRFSSPVTLSLTEEGVYTLSLSAYDQEEAASQTMTRTLTLGSASRRMLMTVLLAAAALVLLILLVRIIVYCANPSYKGRTLRVELTMGAWRQSADVPLSAWKKKKVPLTYVLTCACFPPEEALYAAFSGALMKPARSGVTFAGANSLTFLPEGKKRGRCLLENGQSVSVRLQDMPDAAVTFTLV